LVNLYGDAPLIISSDYTINTGLPRTAQAKIYQQIISDLKDAKNLLTSSYLASNAKSSTVERVRPNRWASATLLARAYAYNNDWKNAEVEADSVINKTSLYKLDTLNGVFLKNSSEAIWQLQPVNAGWNTEDARFFTLPSSGPTSNSSLYGYPVFLSMQLLNSFEANDRRRAEWVDSVIINNTVYYYPFKYKSAILNAPVTEYLMMLRLGELYLIRAESRARQGNLMGLAAALKDLDVIRSRASLPAYSGATDQESVLAAILRERQVELFTEWGHRWLDLKRTHMVDNVMTNVSPTKGLIWNSNWQWYPLPQYDIVQDPNLVQNAGY